MKKNRKKIILQPFENFILITCPVCGFSFNKFDLKKKKENTYCPMCNYKFPSYSKFKMTILNSLDMSFYLKL